MLYINIIPDRFKKCVQPVQQEWHIGSKYPILMERVITFQADGDELMIILDAIKKHSKKEQPVINITETLLTVK